MSYHVPWPKNELWQDDYRWPSGGHKEWHHRWARPVGRVWLRNDEGEDASTRVGCGRMCVVCRVSQVGGETGEVMLPGRIPVPPPAPLPVKSVPPPPVPCVVGRLPSSGRVVASSQEWDALMSVLEGQPRPIMVALDTEFPGFLLEDTPFAPRSARYRALRENVEHLWPIQFGLAVAGSEGLPLGAWTFNLSFNLATNLYSEDSLRDALATLELFLQVSAEKKDEELSHRVENLSSTTTVAPADEAQVSSRDTPDVENETSNSEANSRLGTRNAEGVRACRGARETCRRVG
eukprot:g14723.t1